MAEFSRLVECGMCWRRYVVRGASLNPNNETENAMSFKCVCGASVEAFLPGSANRELVLVEAVGS